MPEEDPGLQTTLWEPTRDHVVVCVDDEAMVLGSLRRLLRKEPYDFRTTEAPDEALKWIADDHVSVFITDQRMPEMTGTDLAGQVRARSPGTMRVILTGYPDLEAIRHRETRLIRRLITKPWSDDDLRKTLRLLLRECELRDRASNSALALEPQPVPVLEREPGGDRIRVRLECRGHRSAEIMPSLVAVLQQPEALLDGVLIEVENLSELGDAYTAFLTTLAAQVLVSGVRVVVREPSGMAALFFRSLFGSAPPVELEMAPPDEGTPDEIHYR